MRGRLLELAVSEGGGMLKEEQTFVEKIIAKVGLGRIGTAGFEKAGAVISIVGDVSASASAGAARLRVLAADLRRIAARAKG